MFEQTFKNIDDILHKDAGVAVNWIMLSKPLGYCSSSIWMT